MNIFRRIYASFTSPNYYQEVIKAPGARAATYYTKFALLAALLAFIVFLFSGSWGFLVDTANLSIVDQVFDYYPDELELTWKDGQLSANVPQPYFLPLPESWQEGMVKNDLRVNQLDSSLENLVVIDTTKELDLEQFESYNTTAWLGQEQMMVYGDKGQLQIIPYDEQTNFSLSKDVVQVWGTYVKGFLKYFRFAFIPLIYATFLFYFIGKLVYLLIAALVIWLILHLKKVPSAGYGQAYKVGLYLLTLPILIEGASNLFLHYYLPTGIFSILLLVMALVMLPKQNQQQI